MNWLNEPPRWSFDDGTLRVSTGDRTDFWRGTHYGFFRDDGHLYYEEREGDFTCVVSFRGDYRELYDQAGLMVRLDQEHWIKAGIEFSDGVQNLSVVCTRAFSDWSILPLAEPPEWTHLRLSRLGDAVKVEWSPDGSNYQMARLAYLPPGGTAQVGPMCCSPQRAGFEVEFRSFKVLDPIARDLHAD
jgi:regulation of enolase protein 1 (concanavalin A-like superfamily)